MKASERARRYRDEDTRDRDLSWTLLHFAFYLLPVALALLYFVLDSRWWWVVLGGAVFIGGWVRWRTRR